MPMATITNKRCTTIRLTCRLFGFPVLCNDCHNIASLSLLHVPYLVHERKEELESQNLCVRERAVLLSCHGYVMVTSWLRHGDITDQQKHKIEVDEDGTPRGQRAVYAWTQERKKERKKERRHIMPRRTTLTLAMSCHAMPCHVKNAAFRATRGRRMVYAKTMVRMLTLCFQGKIDPFGGSQSNGTRES